MRVNQKSKGVIDMDKRKRFVCQNQDCPSREEKFCLEIPEETLMDEKNVAVMYCPHCRSRLIRYNRSEDEKLNCLIA